MIARLRRQLTALALAVLLGLGLIGLAASPASADDAPVVAGPTQVINDTSSSSAALVRDNDGARFHIRRGDYVLHETNEQFFVDFYVARGTTVTIFATDDRGRVISGALQRESRRGWHTTNVAVDDADLVLVRIQRGSGTHRAAAPHAAR